MDKKYYGITHALPLFLLKPWKNIMCKRNMHVFDEVYSSYELDHRLVCDACELIVEIRGIDETYVKR